MPFWILASSPTPERSFPRRRAIGEKLRGDRFGDRVLTSTRTKVAGCPRDLCFTGAGGPGLTYGSTKRGSDVPRDFGTRALAMAGLSITSDAIRERRDDGPSDHRIIANAKPYFMTRRIFMEKLSKDLFDDKKLTSRAEKSAGRCLPACATSIGGGTTYCITACGADVALDFGF